MYLWLIHIVVQQKLTQHCKAIILQLKNFLKKNNNLDINLDIQVDSSLLLCISNLSVYPDPLIEKNKRIPNWVLLHHLPRKSADLFLHGLLQYLLTGSCLLLFSPILWPLQNSQCEESFFQFMSTELLSIYLPSSSISFFRVLNFLAYRFLTFLVNFIPRYFFSPDSVVNGISLLISLIVQS